MRKATESELVSGKEMPLEEWLAVVLTAPDERDSNVYPTCCFPSAEHRDEYLAVVKERPPHELRSLLRAFLIPTGALGCDDMQITAAITNHAAKSLKSEYVCRTLRGGPTWEGVTWVLDLLHRPRLAINVIHSYLAAHFWWMPDWRISGMQDAISLIRAAFLETLHPRDELLAITPREFELLVALLFSRRGYDVTVTRKSCDGGFDVALTASDIGRAESAVVECKRYTKNIGVKEFRSLLGVVERDGATRGILVTTAWFTTWARNESAKTNRIELIDYDALCVLFNEHFGPEWPTNIFSLISDAERQFSSRDECEIVE